MVKLPCSNHEISFKKSLPLQRYGSHQFVEQILDFLEGNKVGLSVESLLLELYLNGPAIPESLSEGVEHFVEGMGRYVAPRRHTAPSSVITLCIKYRAKNSRKDSVFLEREYPAVKVDEQQKVVTTT